MDTKYEFEAEQSEGNPIVYVRPISVETLPEEIREQAEGLDTLYAVHGSDGERIALVRDRRLAFALARQNDMTPVNAH